MITINEFAEQIIGGLTVELGEGYSFSCNEVLKNNGVRFYGVNISDGSRVAPVIYLNQYYEHYTNGDCSVEESISHIIDVYRSNHEMPMDFDTNSFLNWEYVKENLTCKVINTSANSDLLEDIPSVPFIDLSIVFMFAGKTADTNYSILIRNSHLAAWNVSVEDLLEASTSNLRDRFIIKSMAEVLAGMLGYDDADMIPNLDSCPMYILSNESKIFGATGIISTETLHDFAEDIGTDIAIIPSSIHELILVPLTDDINLEYFDDMINEVNTTQVQPEEVLSNHAYIYHKDENQVTAA